MRDLFVSDATATAVWRFHQAALEQAVLIYTFSRSTSGEPGVGDAPTQQLVMLIDIVHRFCFNARKAIERADVDRPGTVAEARRAQVNYETQLPLDSCHGESVNLTQEGLWWILGRIIHSRDTQVLHREIDLIITNHETGAHFVIEQPVGFKFASDNDADGVYHCLHLESLAKCYLRDITPKIEEAIRKRNGLDQRPK